VTDNWYIILELEYDPNPVHDETVIAQRIEEKRKFWRANLNHYKKGPEYRSYLERWSDGTIQRDMIGPQNRRKQLIKEACEITYG
jgi:hypothetical protein